MASRSPTTAQDASGSVSPSAVSAAGTNAAGGNGSGTQQSASLPAFRSLTKQEQRYVLRTAASALVSRAEFASRHGLSHDNARDLYDALGYPRKVSVDDFISRYERGDIAETIIEAYPSATWAGGPAVIENPDPDIDTAFELAVVELFDRLSVWSRVERADICAQLGRYSVLFIGAVGELAQEMPKLPTPNAAALLSLTALPESRAKIERMNEDTGSERFGLPEFYELTLGKLLVRKVHWSRVIHVAEGLLVDDVYGKPRLRAIWNRLMDLDKLIGGGSEAAWKRMDPGLQIDMDPDLVAEMTDEELQEQKEKLSEEYSEHLHGYRRALFTSGITINPLSQTVSPFGSSVDTVLQIISATTRIPHRILTGSERGELASSQDRDNWSDRIMERRREFAIPVVNALVGRLIDYGFLPRPEQTEVVWPETDELNESEKADVAGKLASANKSQVDAGEPVIMTSNEIRLSLYDIGPVEDVSEADDTESEEVDPDAGEQDDVDDGSEDETDDDDLRAAEDNSKRRIVLIGGPRRGKSYIARAYRDQGIPTYCSDPTELVKEPEYGVTYLPDGLGWSEASQYVADNWLTMPAPWCVEGIATARALRKVINAGKLDALSGIEVVVIGSAHPDAHATPEQERAAKGVMTVWEGIKQHFDSVRYLRGAAQKSVSKPILSESRRRLRAAKVSLGDAKPTRKRISLRTI